MLKLLSFPLVILFVAGCSSKHALYTVPPDNQAPATSNLLRTKQNPDRSIIYVYKNGGTCTKRADYTKYVNTKGALKIKTIFDASGSYESKWEKAANVSPKFEELQAVFFDICQEYGENRLSKEEYQQQRATYDKIREALLKGETDDASLKKIAQDVENIKKEREEEKKKQQEIKAPREVNETQHRQIVEELKAASGTPVKIVMLATDDDYGAKILPLFQEAGWKIFLQSIGELHASVNGKLIDTRGLHCLARDSNDKAVEVVRSAFAKAGVPILMNDIPDVGMERPGQLNPNITILIGAKLPPSD